MGYGNHKNRRMNVITPEVGGDGMPVSSEETMPAGRHNAAAAAMIALTERQADEAALIAEAEALAAMYSTGSLVGPAAEA